jgi:outer membrane protein OmpA-like peptidoglycan-associated protein
MVKVQIAGHTDTVGSDDYNTKLSLARAATVKDEMVRLGMDGKAIAVEGKGYHEPLVATAANVREPQNRRAVIDLGS